MPSLYLYLYMILSDFTFDLYVKEMVSYGQIGLLFLSALANLSYTIINIFLRMAKKCIRWKRLRDLKALIGPATFDHMTGTYQDFDKIIEPPKDLVLPNSTAKIYDTFIREGLPGTEHVP